VKERKVIMMEILVNNQPKNVISNKDHMNLHALMMLMMDGMVDIWSLMAKDTAMTSLMDTKRLLNFQSAMMPLKSPKNHWMLSLIISQEVLISTITTML